MPKGDQAKAVEVESVEEYTGPWPRPLDDGSWVTSDNYRFVSNLADKADDLAQRALDHQARVDAPKGKK